MYKQITPTEAKALIDQGPVVIVDVRDRASFEAEHIPDALHLSANGLDALCQSIPLDSAVLLYCFHGISSQVVAQCLVDKGFQHVYSLLGGFETWKLHSTSDTN